MTRHSLISPPDPMGRGDPWAGREVGADFQPISIKFGPNIALYHGWRQQAMNVDHQKKQAQGRTILAALMQSPLYFTIPLSERRLLLKRILESFSKK